MSRASSERLSRYRRENGEWLIELHLREVRQLFHRLDPAPFRDKDLDPDAERYIEDAMRDIGLGGAKRIVVYLPLSERANEGAKTVPEAIRNFFDYRARQTGIELGRLLRLALTNLAIGLAFLTACLAARRALLAEGAHEVLAEGMLIIGWVALWRPVEMFLYDWWPLLRRRRRHQAIARLPVEVR